MPTPLERLLFPQPQPSYIDSNAGANSASATTVSWTHTTTFDTSCLIVCAYVGNSAGTVTISGITFNSINMVSIQNGVAHTDGSDGLFVLFNPPIGSYTIVVTASVAADRGIAGSSMNIRNAKSVHTSGLAAISGTDPLTLTITNTHPLPGLIVSSGCATIGSGASIPVPVVTFTRPCWATQAQYQDWISNLNHKALGLYYSTYAASRQGSLVTSYQSTGTKKSFITAILVNALS